MPVNAVFLGTAVKKSADTKHFW